MTARICRTRPLPIVQASASSWKDFKRAKKASQYLEGEAYRQRFFTRIWPLWVRDSEIFGSGYVCIRRQGKAVLTERVLPTEVWVDEWDAQHGDPRNLYRVRDVDRGVAQEMFSGKAEKGHLRSPDIEERILQAGRIMTPRDVDDAQASTVDRVTLIEAWHLCDDVEAHAPTVSKEDRAAHEKHCTGRYAVVCNVATLDASPWTRGYFPFAKLDYESGLAGYSGQGLAEQLEGYQYEINLIEDRLAESYKMAPGTICYTDGSILDTHITNGIGRVIKGSRGSPPPTFFNPEPVHQSFFQRLEMLINHAYRESGQTVMGISGEKPPGVDAAVAMRQLEDQETGLHVVHARAAEEACMEVGRQWIDCVKEIADEYGDADVAVPMKDGLLELKWSDCNVETFQLRVFSGSMLPSSKSARLQTLKELFEVGAIDVHTFMRQLEVNDLSGEMDLITAGRVLIDEQLEAMLFCENPEDEESYLPPSKYCEKEWALKRVEQKAQWAALRKADAANLALLDRFAADLEQLIDQAKAGAAPAPEPPMPGGPMPGPGGPVLPPGPPGPPALPSNGMPPINPQAMPGAA
jgi:hypothetical protein